MDLSLLKLYKFSRLFNGYGNDYSNGQEEENYNKTLKEKKI
jgi:hypothetical protein